MHLDKRSAVTSTGSPTSPDLELVGVSKYFGSVIAVDDLTFATSKGEFVSILGPSGCGKTTALRIIAGYEQPDTGNILIGGNSLRGVPPHRRNVGMVFQNYALFPHLSVAQNIAFGLEERRLPRDIIRGKVQDIVRLVHLDGLNDRYPNQLSGGQQQRVALARALVIEPEILLLDEPLSNLDAKLREEMRIEIKQLQATLGITTIFVTHDQIEALMLSGRVVVMSQGRVQQIGPPEEVYQHPTTRFTFEFLGGTNVFEGRVSDQSGDTVKFTTQTGMEVLASRSGNADSLATCLGIRLENIRLTDKPIESAPNLFPAVIEQAFFRGWTQEVVVRLRSGELLRLIRLVDRDVSSHSTVTPGASVTLTWSATDCYLLSNDH